MTEESTYGREPLTIVEIRQPRCGLRFGVSPCTATGTPKCYQTWGSCLDRANIDQTGSITWRFCKPRAGIMPIYDEDGEDIATNPIPLLVSASTTSSVINTGAQREGQSPLGVGSTVALEFDDQPWDDHVGDYYLADRTSVQGNFWAKWRARNAFYTGMTTSVYEGYVGQALVDMQRRDHVFSRLVGPDARGRVRVEGTDPLRLAEAKDAMFPRATDIRLVDPIDVSTTAIRVEVVAIEDLTDAFGNTGARKFIRIGQEILLYTGQSLVAGSQYDLTGVARGRFGTAAEEQSVGAVCQRVGRYEDILMWEVAADLIDNHTRIPAAYRDSTQWSDEGMDYLITQKTDRTIPTPEAVEKHLGQLCQQGNFAIWWDERQRKIPLLANRPPKGSPIVVTDALDILADTAETRDDPDAQISRVAIYYAPRNPFDMDKPENYRVLRINIDGDIEAEAAGGVARTLTIYAPWITRDTEALGTASRMLLRYRLIPKYLSFELDANRRSIKIGDVLAVTAGTHIDTEGRPLSTVWQVISAEEHRPGDALRLELQSYFFIGHFGFIMPNTATDAYASATDTEKATGCYIAETVSEMMPGGDEPYLIQ